MSAESWRFCPRCATGLVAPADPARNPVCPTCGWFQPTFALPVVLVLAHDDAGRVVFTRRADWPAGAWGLVAGFIEPGETAEAAALRELAEETGLQASDPRLVRTIGHGTNLLVCIEATIAGQPVAASDVDEVALAAADPGRVPPDWPARLMVEEFATRLGTRADAGPHADADGIARNVAQWTENNRNGLDARAAAAWAGTETCWGVFQVPDAELGSPLGEVRGLDVVELGCGTAYLSAILAKRGARPVGVDPTPAQLATARRMQGETGIQFPLVEAPGERVPLPDASFDLAVSEYGASLWAVPERWVTEAARLLRPGGRLVFLTNSLVAFLCTPDRGDISDRLARPQRGMYRTEWPDEVGVEYHLAPSGWIDLLHRSGFAIERLVDVYATERSRRHELYGYVSPEWARRWPAEELWVARKVG